MDGESLLNVLRCANHRHNNKYTVGVFASDLIPKNLTYPAAIISNTHDHTRPGEHWIAFFISSKGALEYFDSFGLPPLTTDHLEFISTQNSRFSDNKMMLQGLKTKVCGQYCLLYLLSRMNGKSLKHFQSLFTKNDKANDKLVVKMLRQIKVKWCIKKVISKTNKRGQQRCCSKLSNIHARGLVSTI